MQPFPPSDLIARYDRPGPRYTSYPPVPHWSAELTPSLYAQALRRTGEQPGPLSLYFHLPFCARLCTYCGCNMVITRDQTRADGYIDQLEREMDLVLGHLGARKSVRQLHWGGGTPTFLDGTQLARLWNAIFSRFERTPDLEASIEINPATVRHDQLEVLWGLGFNRYSVGVQDFDGQVQKTINRYQTEEQTRAVVETLRGFGAPGINFDLVYGLPHQTPQTWARTLEKVLAMRPDRISAYAFAFMPDVIPHQRKLPVAATPAGAAKLELFRAAYAAFTAAGYVPIGMDHFALPHDSLARAQHDGALTRNFQGYTVRAATDTIGFGASAISDAGGVYAQNEKELDDYAQALERGELPTAKGFALSNDDQRRRTLLQHLFCDFAVDLGEGGAQRYANELERLRPLQDDALVALHGDRLEITPAGRFFVRNVAMAFDAYQGRAGRFSRTV